MGQWGESSRVLSPPRVLCRAVPCLSITANAASTMSWLHARTHAHINTRISRLHHLQDLTRLRSEAIVHSTNETLSESGEDAKKLHAAAGPELQAACQLIANCRTGDVKWVHRPLSCWCSCRGAAPRNLGLKVGAALRESSRAAQ